MIKNNIVFLNEYYASEILIPPIFDVKNVVLGVQNYFPFIQMNFTWPQEDIFYKSHFGPHIGDYLMVTIKSTCIGSSRKCHTSLLYISRHKTLLSDIHLLITFEMLWEWDPEI